MQVRFLVCALFYGDYPDIARRCAESLEALRRTGLVDIRLGLNEVSARTCAILDTVLPGVEQIVAEPQIYKYPMMRRLVNEYRGDATHLMWFDDDSCLRPGVNAAAWLALLTTRAARTGAVLGSVYEITTPDVLRAWVERQPWYTGRAHPQRIQFPVGGWFVTPLDLLHRFDWPPPSLRHNGGDMAFGALLHQQGLALDGFRDGVAINADEALVETRSPRRGYSERPLGI